MIRALATKGLRFPTHLQRFAFSGGHHAKPYDWRDDHALNPYFEEDPRKTGVPNPYEYAQPFQSPPNAYESAFPADYNPKDLTQNYVGSYRLRSVAETNLLEPHQQNLWEDMMHEWDYESEDLDFQPESFHSQHFRKKGMMWMWVGIALVPYWFVIQEVIYNQMVDGDQNKYQRPPPLNYPDEEDTPDTEAIEIWNSPEFTYLHDGGMLRDPYLSSYPATSKSLTARRSTTSGPVSTSQELSSGDSDR